MLARCSCGNSAMTTDGRNTVKTEFEPLTKLERRELELRRQVELADCDAHMAETREEFEAASQRVYALQSEVDAIFFPIFNRAVGV
jgi:hypothetical protein